METREKIIEKTFELLLQKGYDGVSISDIQNATGSARGLLYHYFGNKDTLFFEASKHHFSEAFLIDLDAIKGYDVPRTIDYIIEKYQHLIQNTLKETSIINYDFLFYRLMQQSEEFVILYDKMRKDELKAWLTALQNSSIRSDLNLEKIAQQFVCTTDGVWLRAVTPKTEVNLIEILREALETLFNLLKK